MSPTLHDWPRALVVAIGAVALGALVALGVVVGEPELLLSNDGPQHLFRALTAMRLESGDASAAQLYVVEMTPTSHGFPEVFRAFATFSSWRTAYAATLVSFAVAWALAALFLLVIDKEARGRRLVLVPLACVAALHWSFYLGFLPYHLSGAWVFVVAAAWARADERRLLHVVLLGVAALLAAMCHLLGGVFALMAAGFITLARRPRHVLVVALASLPAFALFLWIRSGTASRDGLEVVPWEWLPWSERLSMPMTHVVPGPWWRAGLVPVVLIAGTALGALAKRPLDRAFAWTAAALVVLSVALPYTGPWQLVAPRPLALAVVFALAALPVERVGPRAAAALVAVVVSWSGASFWWTRGFHEELDELAVPVKKLLEAGPSAAAVRAPLILKPAPRLPVPELDPLFHFGALVSADWGGYTHFTQTGLAVSGHSVRLIDDVEAALPASPPFAMVREARAARELSTRKRIVARVAAEAAASDEVVVVGIPEDIDVVLRAGVVARAFGPDWLVGSVPRCPTRVEVRGLRGPVALEVGVEGASGGFRYEVAPAPGSDVQEMTSSFPCLPMWIRASGGMRCAGAGPDGKVKVPDARPTDGPRVLRCTVGEQAAE